MKYLLKSEEWALFVGSIYLFSLLPFAWWWFPALLLVPDLGMIGYLISPAVGAVTYNIAHHRGLGVLIGLLGLALGHPALMLTGLILFAHCCFDRALGFGLKYSDSFKHTSLGHTSLGHTA